MIDIDYSTIKNLPSLFGLLSKSNITKNEYWMYINAYQDYKAREKGIPRFGMFEITPLCNLDCKMCYVHLSKDQLNGVKLLPVEWWKKIVLKAYSSGMMYATLTGGECLTYPGFDELYLFLRSLGIRASIKTNGLLLNKERIAFFEKYPPQSITISLYGSSNEIYNKVTGHPVFDIVYSNLLHLKDTNIKTSIAITPNVDMNEDVIHVVDLVHQLDLPCSINVMLFPPRKETGRQLTDLSHRNYVELFKSLRKANSNCPSSVDEVDLPECGKSGEPEFGIRCDAGRSSFFIRWNGYISACNNLNSLNISLIDNSFAEAWNMIHSEAVSYPLPIECTNCAYNKVCFGCIAYRTYDSEIGHCNSSICERTKLLVREGIYKL